MLALNQPEVLRPRSADTIAKALKFP